jgi:hypothetical protein
MYILPISVALLWTVKASSSVDNYGKIRVKIRVKISVKISVRLSVRLRVTLRLRFRLRLKQHDNLTFKCRTNCNQTNARTAHGTHVRETFQIV